MLYHVTFAVTL